MNNLLQRLTVVSSIIIAVPFSLVWASKAPQEYRGSAATGTYQVISDQDFQAKYPANFMDSMRVVIQAKRDVEKEIVLQITPETKIRILPEREISKPQFRPVEEYVFVARKVKKIVAE